MRRSSWLWAALLAALGLSLALNVFAAGYVLRTAGDGGGARLLMGGAAAAYPPAVKQEFRAVMRANRARTRAALGELRTARAALATAAAATPLDAAAVERAMLGVREATALLQATMQDYLLTALKIVSEKPAG